MNKKNKRKAYKNQPAYTLAELMGIIGILIILFAMGLRGLVNAQAAFKFNNSYQQVLSLVRQARSLAVTGRAQLDYTDYDQDGLDHLDGDKVAPANYGVHIDTASKKVIMFADIHDDGNNEEGVFEDPGALYTRAAEKDLSLAEFNLPDDLDFILDPTTTDTVFFSPIFADTTFDQGLDAVIPEATTFKFGVTEMPGAIIMRQRCATIHPIGGVPEESSC